MTINNISPWRYPGGKTRACKKLDHILRENLIWTTLIALFGGGSFEFFLQSHYNLKIYAIMCFMINCPSFTGCILSEGFSLESSTKRLQNLLLMKFQNWTYPL